MATRFVAPTTTADYRLLAEKRLPRFLFDYIDGGANDERTLDKNTADFGAIQLRQRVMRDVEHIDLSTQLLGEDATMPLMLAPVGMAGMMARRAEAQAASAAREAGIPFTISTLGVCPMEEVIEASGAPIWFQLYMLRDRDAVQRLLDRALRNGVTTLVFTVDLAMPGQRYRDNRNGMIGDRKLAMALSKAHQLLTRPRWILDVGVKGKPHTIGNLSDVVPDPTDLNEYRKYVEQQFDPSVTWADIEWIRSIWPHKLVIKGVLDADDARAARDAGADAVVVSNHGGRQLDSVASSIQMLPAVADAVGADIEVYMDGGIRSGLDVLKAVALGADGVLMGRPWIYATAAEGKAGLFALLNAFKREMEVGLALMGLTRIADLSRDHIYSSL